VKLPGQPDDGRNFREIASDIAARMIRIFTRNERGHRPVYGENSILQDSPQWKDYILFYEFYHGDNGSGLGASHQTGWSALVAALIDEWRQ
jgi:hypothetical protein